MPEENISGPCVACDNIVSFEAPTCPKCGQPDAGKKAKEAAEARHPFWKEFTPEGEAELLRKGDASATRGKGGGHHHTCSKCGKSFEFYEEGGGHYVSAALLGMSGLLWAASKLVHDPYEDKPTRDCGCPYCGHSIPKDTKPKK